MFSLSENETNYRQVKDKELILIFVSAGGFTSDANIFHNIKPVLVQYDLVFNEFIQIETSLPIVPFISSYIYPGWNIFDRLNTNYRNNLIESIKQYGRAQTFTR